MLTRTKLLLVVATMMLSLVATASARNFSFREKEFEIRGPITFEAAGSRVTCSYTALGRFLERTFAKTDFRRFAQIRHVNRGTGACTGGESTILNETLPWEVEYEGFSGTLPRITAMRLGIIGMAFRVSLGGLGCLFGTTSRSPVFGEFLINSEAGANRGKVESFRYDERVGIPLGGSFLCSFGGEGHLSGSDTVTDLPGVNAFMATLI